MGLRLTGWSQLLTFGYTVEHARCGLQVLTVLGCVAAACLLTRQGPTVITC